MTGKIHTLRPDVVSPLDPVPKVVELLEDLLEKAKSGEIRSFGFVTTDADRNVQTGWHHQHELFTLIGGVSWLHTRLLAPDPVG